MIDRSTFKCAVGTDYSCFWQAAWSGANVAGKLRRPSRAAECWHWDHRAV